MTFQPNQLSLSNPHSFTSSDPLVSKSIFRSSLVINSIFKNRPLKSGRMDSTPKNSYVSLKNMSLFFLMIVTGLFFLSLVTLNPSTALFSSISHQSSRPNKTPMSMSSEDELGEALRRASMANKTVIIGIVNRAYVEGKVMPNMLDLFLEGFWAGEGTKELVNHLIIVAVDQTAYERCLFRGLHCYRLPTDDANFVGEQVFMSNDFINMMWRRTFFLLQVLRRGYSFIFTDTDVIWLRNPFSILTRDEESHELDIQLSTDFYNGNSTSVSNPINTGFYFVKSNKKTITLFEKWYGYKDNSTGLKEQDVLQNMTWKGVLGDLGLRFRFLETRLFSGFCEESPDVHAVVTIHANCCRFISAKVTDLARVLRQWLRFRADPSNQTTPFQWPNHVQCLKSWD